ncbi:MAG: response regulator transcription factor [Bacteroidota bacterium]
MIQQNLKTIRVLIADDHILLREGFRTLLRYNPEIEIVGAAENGKELIELTRSLEPDIICTDIKMPVMDGVQATRIINHEFPDIGIIALTIYDDEHLIVDMMEAGAKGYLIKNAAKNEVLEAIHNVYDGLTYYCRHTSAKLAKMIATSKFNPYKKGATPEFSEKERTIIQLVCQGKF